MLFKRLLGRMNPTTLSAGHSSCLRHTWEVPKGHSTRINIYNCVKRKKEPLIVQNPNAISWYTCGPTVYDSAHIGHASCYVKLDIIQRILRQHFKLNIVSVMNITDIDDKIIKRASETNINYEELAMRYEKEFWEDLAALKVAKPDFVVKVTENMQLIIDFIQKLINSNQAYITSDNSVYFDVKSVSDCYGKLQNIGETFEDPKNPQKRSPMDFALWKSPKSQKEPAWVSPWGKGRPGWHIECSALASHVFGSNIDIHAGGIDLRFPHHENEEIQSCRFHGNNQWVNYWIHIGHLHVKDSEKMSKSLKNTISIQDLLKESTPDVFRLACAMSHYSSRIEFGKQWLETASNLLKVFKNFSVSVKEVERGLLKVKINSLTLKNLLENSTKEIDAAFCNDFNTVQVVEVLCKVVSACNTMIVHTGPSKFSEDQDSSQFDGDLHYMLALHNLVRNTLKIFNVEINDSTTVSDVDDSTEFINLLVDFRQSVRQLGLSQKNEDLLRICDNIRDNLYKNGVMIKDHGKVSAWSKQ